MQSALKTQQLAFAQAGSNQLQALAGVATNRIMATLATTNQAAATATNQLQALASTVSNPVLATLATTNQVATATTNQVQALLETAKTLSSNQKYQEALGTLAQVYETKLTPDQKQKADELKAQIQTMLTEKAASGASSVLGNILGGKK
jgi:hypothetical protein